MRWFQRGSNLTPEDLVDLLRELGRPVIRSVLLYGSAVAGDHAGRRSDLNLLIVTDSLDPEDLRALREGTRRWVGQGNPPPLFLTTEQLAGSCDVFPIEILDIRDSHRLLHGEDLVANLQVNRENLRLQLEHELKSKLIQLREAYLLTEGKPERVIRLVVDSLSSILVLARATLRLFTDQVPGRKLEAARELTRFLDLDLAVLEQVSRLKEGSLSPREVQAESLFSAYLGTVDLLVRQVDSYLSGQSPQLKESRQ